MAQGDNSSDDDRNSRIQDTDYRIELVRRYMVRGVTNAYDIKDNLALHQPAIIVDIRTVYRYIAAAKKLTLELVKKREGLDKPLVHLIVELKNTYDEITKELWKQYYAPFSTPASRVAALKELREAADSWVEKLQKLGLVPEAPIKIELSSKDPTVQSLAAEDKMVLSQQFTQFFKGLHQDPISTKPQAEGLQQLK